jgi:hypothetical protein
MEWRSWCTELIERHGESRNIQQQLQVGCCFGV